MLLRVLRLAPAPTDLTLAVGLDGRQLSDLVLVLEDKLNELLVFLAAELGTTQLSGLNEHLQLTPTVMGQHIEGQIFHNSHLPGPGP